MSSHSDEEPNHIVIGCRFTDEGIRLLMETCAELVNEGIIDPYDMVREDADLTLTVLANKFLDAIPADEPRPTLDQTILSIRYAMHVEAERIIQQLSLGGLE